MMSGITWSETCKRMKRGDVRRSDGQRRGARCAETLERTKVHGIDAFELFCAYHLGITRANTYRFQNLHDLAGALAKNAGEIHSALKVYGMADVVGCAFNLAKARVDIELADRGSDLRALAVEIYEAFLGDNSTRDWGAELDLAALMNQADPERG